MSGPSTVSSLDYWQQRYRSNDMPWDKGMPSPGLEDYLNDRQLAGKILLPGCGTGHDARLLATTSPQAKVVAMDIVPEAIELARSQSGEHEIEFVVGDYLQPGKHLLESFDWIIEHTLFCAIDPAERLAYVSATAQLLKPGGKYLAIFYLDPSGERDGPPFGTTKEELDRLFGANFQLEQEWLPKRNYETRVGRELMRILCKSG